jgi:hypothetical protein
VRVAGHYVKMSDGWIQALAGPTTGGAVNPFTGDFTPGIAYGPGPTYTPMPATPQPSTLTRAGYGDRDERVYADFQNDWVYDLKLPHVDSSSQAGFSYEYDQSDQLSGAHADGGSDRSAESAPKFHDLAHAGLCARKPQSV